MWEKNKKLKTITGKQPKQRVRIRFYRVSTKIALLNLIFLG